jgi:hypothetical protein
MPIFNAKLRKKFSRDGFEQNLGTDIQEARMAAAAAIPPVEPRQLSEGQRLLDVFIAPSKTFTDLRRNAMWWAPFLIICIVSTLYVYLVDQRVGFRKVVDNLIQLQPKQAEKIDQMPADRRETVMRQQATITKFISYAIPLIGLLFYLVMSAVLYATFKFGANAQMSFGALYALVVYSRLPELLRVLLSGASLLAGVNIDSFNLQNPIAANPGYFVGPDGSPVLRALLTPIDLLTFWTLALLAIGVPCISNVKRGTAFAIIFGWFAFIIIARVGLAALTG